MDSTGHESASRKVLHVTGGPLRALALGPAFLAAAAGPLVEVHRLEGPAVQPLVLQVPAHALAVVGEQLVVAAEGRLLLCSVTGARLHELTIEEVGRTRLSTQIRRGTSMSHMQSQGACCSMDARDGVVAALTQHGYLHAWRVDGSGAPSLVVGSLHVELPVAVRKGMRPALVRLNSGASKVLCGVGFIVFAASAILLHTICTLTGGRVVGGGRCAGPSCWPVQSTHDC